MARTKNRKKRWVLLGVAIVAVAVIGFGANAARGWIRDSQAKAARAEGMALYEAENYDAALGKLSDVLARFPNDLEALLAFADTRFQVEQDGGRHILTAIGLYTRVLDLEPDNFEAQEGLLEAYSSIRYARRPQLKSVADRILEQDSDHRAALEARAWCFTRIGEFRDAAEDARRICASHPTDFNARQLLLGLLNEAGARDDELLAECDAFISLTQNIDGRGHVLKAMVLAVRGRGYEANESLTQSIEAGVSVETLDETLSMLDAHPDVLYARDTAAAVIARVRAGGDPAVHEMLVERYWQRGAMADALLEVEAGLAAEGSDTVALTRWNALLQVTSNSGDAAEYVRAYEEKLATTKATPRDEAWLAALGALVSDAPLKSMIAELEAAGRKQPNDPILMFLRADAFMRAGEWERAGNLLEDAHRVDPDWATAADAYAKSLLQLGRLNRAYAAARENVTRYRRTTIEPYVTLLRAWTAVQRRFGETPAVQGLRPLDAGADMFAKRLYDESGRPPVVLPYVVEAYCVYDRSDDASSIVYEAIESDVDIPSGTLRVIAATAATYQLECFEAVATAAEQAGADTIELAQLRASWHLNRDAPDDAWAALQNVQASDPERQHQLDLIRMQFAALCERPESDHLEYYKVLSASAYLSATEIAYLLSTRVAWLDSAKEITRGLIDTLATMIGDDSVRVRLMRARDALEFDAENDKAIAVARNDIGDLLMEVPDSLPALVVMSRLLRDTAPVSAQEALRKAVDLYPERESLYPELISLLQRVGYYSEAEEYLTRFADLLDRQLESERQEAQLLITQGDFSAALSRLEELLSDESVFEQDFTLAQIALRAGDDRVVERFLDDYRAEGESNFLYIEFANEYFVSRGRAAEAESLLAACASTISPSDHALLTAAFFKQTNRHAEAAELSQQAIELDPGNARAHYVLATNYLLAEQHQAAADAALRGLEESAAGAAGGAGQALGWERQLQVVVASASLALGPEARARAIALFESFDGVDEGLVDTVKLFDEVVAADGMLNPTRAHLRRALEITEQHPLLLPAWQLAVTLHEAAGMVREAKRTAREAMRRLRTRPEPVSRYLRFLLEEGSLSEALVIAQEWRLRTLDDPYKADLAIANLSLISVDYDRAASALRPHETRIEAMRDTPPFNLWVRTLILSGDAAHAFTLLEDDLAKNDQAFNSWLGTCLILAATDPQRAEEAAMLVRDLATIEKPDRVLEYALDWAHIGRWQLDQTHFAEALDMINAIDAADQEMQINVMRAKALVATDANDHQRAVDLYREILALAPGDLLSLNNIAYALADKLGRPDEAIGYSERMMQDPAGRDSPQLVDTHAIVLLHAGRLDEALGTIDELLQTADTPGFRYTRARIVYAQNDVEGARAELGRVDQSLQRNPAGYRELREEVTSFRRSISGRGNSRGDS